jgi:ABC-2 type transport system permease protein
MNLHVLWAVFRRNFVSYFANPTGYVFICLFVLFGAVLAFCLPEFFNSNLANLDQLSFWFPFVMLVYVPTITMGIWADERKQGTDELLLTIPARDFDIVIGKYLAAVAIFSVSLLFSLVCNYVVLNSLAGTHFFPESASAPAQYHRGLSALSNIDVGLFLCTYFGYWLVGLAMLAIGVVASFLTSNITIGFVLGVLFNMPLVFLSSAGAILGSVGRERLSAIKTWGIAQQFHDFSRGVLSLDSLAYFITILVVMLYVSMVLIGRRHWLKGTLMPTRRVALLTLGLAICATVLGIVYYVFTKVLVVPVHSFQVNIELMAGLAIILGVLFFTVAFAPWPWEKQEHSTYMFLQYVLRSLSLGVIAIGLVVVFRYHDVRSDWTSAQLSSLAPQTVELLRNLKADRPVQIDAFISPTVPESYVQTRLNLLNTLTELRALGGKKLQVQIHETERFSAEAALAAKRYGIEPRQVTTLEHGALTENYLFLFVVVKSGKGKPAIAFIDRDVPVEYELVRSICGVSQQKRLRLGVLNTDVQLYGGFNMQNMSSIPQWPIIDELEKQYDVVKVDPAKPIEKFDVLLAVQPSSLGREDMDRFVAAVQGGQPTVIFEDPCPTFAGGVPATSAPRQPPGGMNPMMMRAPPPEKGDIKKLWDVLGIEFIADQVVWQDYNPYPKIPLFVENKEFVFVDAGCGAKHPFSPTDPIASGLQQVLFPFSGYITKLNVANNEFTPLVRTGEKTGTVLYGEIMQSSPFGQRGGLNPDRRKTRTGDSYILAAHIQGTKGKGPRLNCVLVADIDMLSPLFFRLREQGEIPELGVHLDFDNVTLALNALDDLAGDQRFIEIRKRRPQHRTLVRIEDRTKDAKQQAADATDKLRKDYEAEEQKEQQGIEEKVAELKKRKDMDPNQLMTELALTMRDLEQRKEVKLEQRRQDRKRKTEQIETDLKEKVDTVRFQYKLWAVLLPPIPPLLVAAFVFFTRRAREREGVARSRLR